MVGSVLRDLQSSKQTIAGRVFSGVVVDNNDPQRLQRCRIRIRDLHRELQDSEIPWARKRDASRGTAPGLTNVDVPPMGSQVNVSFNEESLYSPEYFGGVFSHPQQAAPAEGYPHVILEQDQGGNFIRRDTRAGYNSITIGHASGTIVEINNSGDVRITSAGKIEMSSLQAVDIRSGGDIFLQAAGTIHLRSQSLLAQPPLPPGPAAAPWPVTPVPRPVISFAPNTVEY
jgi:hypothetical protein